MLFYLPDKITDFSKKRFGAACYLESVSKAQRVGLQCYLWPQFDILRKIVTGAFPSQLLNLGTPPKVMILHPPKDLRSLGPIGYLLVFLLGLTHPCLGQVIEYHTSIGVRKGVRTTETTVTLRIDQKTKWMSQIRIPYKDDQKIQVLHAHIAGADGKVLRQLKGNEMTTVSHRSRGTFHQDRYEKEFQLSWDQYPYYISYAYRVTDKDFLHVAIWHPCLYEQVPTMEATLEVSVPLDYEVTVDYADEFVYTSAESDGSQIYRWMARDQTWPTQETLGPPSAELVPRVIVVPTDFHYVIDGSMQSWSTFGAWNQQLIEGTMELPSADQATVDRLVAGAHDKREIITRLYHYLQDNTRYVNVAIDAGGLKPYPASYVSQNKYGDCKALTIFMKSMLDHVDIPSFYTLVASGTNPRRIQLELPWQQFDHVVLAVPLASDTVWLENTTDYLPSGYLGSFTQNRYALHVEGPHSKIVRTPALLADEVLQELDLNVALQPDGQGRASLTKTMRGSDFEAYRYYIQELSEQDLHKTVAGELPLPGTEIASWRFQPSDREDHHLTLDMDLQLTEQLRQVGPLLLLNPPTMPLPAMETPDKREAPLRICSPIHQQWSLAYNLAEFDRYSMELPTLGSLDTPFGRFEANISQDGAQVIITSSLYIASGDYPLSDYPAFFDFIEAIDKLQKQSTIILKSKT